MASINMEFPFPDSLSQDEARKRMKEFLVKLKNKYGDKISNLEEKWNENTGHFSFLLDHFRVFGSVTVKPSEMELSINNLPFAANFFMGDIRSTIMEEVEKLFS